MVENNLVCFYTFFHKTRKKIFSLPLSRLLLYGVVFFSFINYQNETFQILKSIGWYLFFVVLSTLPIILVWHLSIKYYYFIELKSIATDLRMAEIYAHQNSQSYNDIFLLALRIIRKRLTLPRDDFTISEDVMFTTWGLHTKLGTDFNAWYCNLQICSCFNSMRSAITKLFYTLLKKFLHSSQTSQYKVPQPKRKTKKSKTTKVSNTRFDLDEPSLKSTKKWKLLGFESEESYNSDLFDKRIRRLLYYLVLIITPLTIIIGIYSHNIDTRRTSKNYENLYSAPTYSSTTDCADKPTPSPSIFTLSAKINKPDVLPTTYNTTIQNFNHDLTATTNSSKKNDTTQRSYVYQQTIEQKADTLSRIFTYNIHANNTKTVQTQVNKYKNKTYNLNVSAVIYNTTQKHVKSFLKVNDEIIYNLSFAKNHNNKHTKSIIIKKYKALPTNQLEFNQKNIYVKNFLNLTQLQLRRGQQELELLEALIHEKSNQPVHESNGLLLTIYKLMLVLTLGVLLIKYCFKPNHLILIYYNCQSSFPIIVNNYSGGVNNIKLVINCLPRGWFLSHGKLTSCFHLPSIKTIYNNFQLKFYSWILKIKNAFKTSIFKKLYLFRLVQISPLL